LTSYHFNEIELEHDCEPEPQFCDSILIFYLILTHVLLPNMNLPDLNRTPESVLIPLPVNLELESPMLPNHIPMENEYEPKLQFFLFGPNF